MLNSTPVFSLHHDALPALEAAIRASNREALMAAAGNSRLGAAKTTSSPSGRPLVDRLSIVGQERGGLLLLSYNTDDPSDGWAAKTHIDAYDVLHDRVHRLFKHSGTIRVVCASVNSSRSLLGYTHGYRLKSTSSSASQIVYESALVEVSPQGKVYSLAVKSSAFQRIQFINHTSSSSIYFLFFLDKAFIHLYHITLAPRTLGKGLKISAQPHLQSLITKAHLWFQWDSLKQHLYYISLKPASGSSSTDAAAASAGPFVETITAVNFADPKHATLFEAPYAWADASRQDLILAAGGTSGREYRHIHFNQVQASPDSRLKYSIVRLRGDAVVLCQQHVVTSPSKDRHSTKSLQNPASSPMELPPPPGATHIAVSIYVLHYHFRLNFSIPVPPSKSSHVDKIDVTFTSIGDMLLVYVPGLYFRLLDIGAEHHPCDGITITHNSPLVPHPYASLKAAVEAASKSQSGSARSSRSSSSKASSSSKKSSGKKPADALGTGGATLASYTTSGGKRHKGRLSVRDHSSSVARSASHSSTAPIGSGASAQTSSISLSTGTASSASEGTSWSSAASSSGSSVTRLKALWDWVKAPPTPPPTASSSKRKSKKASASLASSLDASSSAPPPALRPIELTPQIEVVSPIAESSGRFLFDPASGIIFELSISSSGLRSMLTDPAWAHAYPKLMHFILVHAQDTDLAQEFLSHLAVDDQQHLLRPVLTEYLLGTPYQTVKSANLSPEFLQLLPCTALIPLTKFIVPEKGRLKKNTVRLPPNNKALARKLLSDTTDTSSPLAVSVLLPSTERPLPASRPNSPPSSRRGTAEPSEARPSEPALPPPPVAMPFPAPGLAETATTPSSTDEGQSGFKAPRPGRNSTGGAHTRIRGFDFETSSKARAAWAGGGDWDAGVLFGWVGSLFGGSKEDSIGRSGMAALSASRASGRIDSGGIFSGEPDEEPFYPGPQALLAKTRSDFVMLLTSYFRAHRSRESRSACQQWATLFANAQNSTISRIAKTLAMGVSRSRASDHIYLQLLEEMYNALEEDAMPYPKGFHYLFATIAYSCMPRFTFIQWVHRGVLRMTPEFVDRVASSLNPNSIPDNEFRYELVSALSRRQHALEELHKIRAAQTYLLEYNGSLLTSLKPLKGTFADVMGEDGAAGSRTESGTLPNPAAVRAASVSSTSSSPARERNSYEFLPVVAYRNTAWHKYRNNPAKNPPPEIVYLHTYGRNLIPLPRETFKIGAGMAASRLKHTRSPSTTSRNSLTSTRRPTIRDDAKLMDQAISMANPKPETKGISGMFKGLFG